jgi:hypothetical protein
LSRDAVVNAVEPHILIEVEASASWRVEPFRKPDSTLSRLMGLRVSDDVGGCLVDRDFREILVEACQSESGDVGVGWGRKWGQRSCYPSPSDSFCL